VWTPKNKLEGGHRRPMHHGGIKKANVLKRLCEKAIHDRLQTGLGGNGLRKKMVSVRGPDGKGKKRSTGEG